MGQTGIRWLACLLAMLTFGQLGETALAQTSLVELKFVGTITGSAADSLVINGQPWTGPLPDFPYVKGDQVTLTMNVQPSSEYLDPNYPAKPADGIYRFSVVGAASTGVTSAVAPIRSMDLSGPIVSPGGAEASAGIVMTYNSNTGTWGMEMPRGSYSLFRFDGPGYLYDPASNTVSLASTTSDPIFHCTDMGNGCFGLTGSMTTTSVNRAPVWGTDGSLRGFWSMLMSGDWFVNGVKQGTGGSTDVPEPGQLGMMALALLPLLARRRRRVSVR